MKEQETEKYISLKKATKYCSYSQEYLSLRARQGKLKAIKFGRNWVTKKEWLNEYLFGIEEYNDNFAKEKKVIAPPKDLPTEEQLKKDIIGLDEWAGLDFDFDFGKLRKAFKPELQMRFGFVVIFTLSLIVTNLVFGQESFKSVYQDVSDLAYFSIETVDSIVSSVDKGIDEVLVDMSKGAQEVVQGVNDNIDRKAIEIVEISKQVLGNISDGTANLKGFVLEIIEAYGLADKFLDKKVVDLGKQIVSFVNNALSNTNKSVRSFASQIKDGYIAADNFVDNKIFGFGRTILNGLRFVVGPWTGAPVAFEPIEEIRTEIARLKEEGVPAKEIIIEVSKITQVEPVKEITKELIKVDDSKLSLLQARVASLEEDIVKRLYAPGGVVSQTVYLTQPVSSPKVYQQNGDIVFQTLGSGSVIMSAATGLQLSGQQVVIDSTSQLSPLVYIADHTKIAGDLTVTGSQTFSGPLTLNVNSITPALSITQSGTGDIISISRTGGGSFVINEDGFIVGVGTLRIEEPDGEIWEMGVTAGKLTYTTALTLASGGTGDIVLDPASGIIQAATGDVYYTEGGHPIRESGEQLLREMIPIFGFDLPSRTASTTYITVSRTIEDYAFPAAMTGTTRVHKFIIRYADTATGGTSTWQVYNVTDSAQTAEFTVPNSDSTDIDKGEAYIVAVDIPVDTDDWRLDVKVDSGSIQIYQIFLAAYDQVD